MIGLDANCGTGGLLRSICWENVRVLVILLVEGGVLWREQVGAAGIEVLFAEQTWIDWWGGLAAQVGVIFMKYQWQVGLVSVSKTYLQNVTIIYRLIGRG